MLQEGFGAFRGHRQNILLMHPKNFWGQLHFAYVLKVGDIAKTSFYVPKILET